MIASAVDFWSPAALNEPGLLVFFFMLLLRICDVAVTVPGYISLGVLGLRFIAAAVAAAAACVGVLMVALSYEFSGGSFKTPNVGIRQPAAATFQATSIDGATLALATATSGPRFACKAPRVDVDVARQCVPLPVLLQVPGTHDHPVKTSGRFQVFVKGLAGHTHW